MFLAGHVFFLINNEPISTKLKTYLIVLLSLFWMLLMTVWASTEPQGTYNDLFLREIPLKAPKLSHIECNCVAWAKWYLQRENESWGYPEAIRVKPEGEVVVTREGQFGHVAVITSKDEKNLYLLEANYKPCEISTRSLDINSPLIRGYY